MLDFSKIKIKIWDIFYIQDFILYIMYNNNYYYFPLIYSVNNYCICISTYKLES